MTDTLTPPHPNWVSHIPEGTVSLPGYWYVFPSIKRGKEIESYLICNPNYDTRDTPSFDTVIEAMAGIRKYLEDPTPSPDRRFRPTTVQVKTRWPPSNFKP